MQKQTIFDTNKTIMRFSIFAVILLSNVFCNLIFLNNVVLAADYTLSLTSSGSQNIDIETNTGTAISADTINVSTSCRYGYNLVSSTSVNDNNLYLNGNSSNNTSGTYFSPANGTTALKDATNTWGYYYNANSSTAPTINNVFNPVPTLGNTDTIKTSLQEASSTDISDTFNIYYGVNASPTMAKGTYKMIPDTNNSNNDGTIVYQATMAEACTQYTVHFSPAGYFEGNLITGAGTMSDQSIYEGISTSLSTLTFSNPTTINNVDYYFAGWNTQQDGSGTSYYNTEDVTDLATVGSTVTLYAMWTDCPQNKICYNANGTGIVGEMGDETISNTDTSITLYAPNYKHSNYGFAAWNTKADGSGTNYGPQQTIEFTAGQYSTGGLKLYAKWIVSAGNMQGWTGCSSMNEGDVTALKDTRDNDVYAVAKLADGKCWMIENLRLDDGPELTSANTNNPSLPLTNVYDTNSKSNYLSPTSSVNYDATTAPEGWCTTYSTACIDQSRIRTDNTVLFINNTSTNYDAGGDIYSYGNYYNWYSATAGYGKYGNTWGSSSASPGDICPAGWHLTSGRKTSGDIVVLDTIMGGTGDYMSDDVAEVQSKKWRSYPINYVYSGSGYAWIDSRNVYARYWASTEMSSAYSHALTFGVGYFTPATSGSAKYFGETVRCISGT
ncbi:InlB B-repeat-containing protein [Candidatus Saccharibacteria bacterium]|nr:InlB B-repeat-containing protein [Candidatus Saccharibacteria bacterium]